MLVLVAEGTVSADSLWMLTTNAPISVGATRSLSDWGLITSYLPPVQLTGFNNFYYQETFAEIYPGFCGKFVLSQPIWLRCGAF